MSNKLSVNIRRNLIHNKLRNGDILDSQTLADEFSVSWRTIHRDFVEYFTTIEEALVQNNDTHRWYISKELKKSLLSQKEQVTLDLLLELSKKHSGDFYLQTKELLERLTNSTNDSIFYAKINSEDFSDIKNQMIQVEQAIIDKAIITCKYNNKNRTVAPLKIASFDGYWYLIVKDLNKDIKDINTYYFKDIQDLKVSEKTHEITCPQLQKKLDNAINAYFVADKNSYLVTLHATKNIAKFFKRKPISKSQRIIQEYQDGSLDLEVMITHEMEIEPIVKMYSPDLKRV